MAQKYYNGAEAAKILGVSPAEINQMVLRRELYGFRDGSDWKFKAEDIDRAAAGVFHEHQSGHATLLNRPPIDLAGLLSCDAVQR